MDKIHLKSPKNWINDPNGFIYYKGMYHLFYQHFPFEPRWGTMYWGHAVSKDLTNWEHKDIALFPTKFEDQNGCFSGSAIEHEGSLYLYYTGVHYTKVNPEDIHHYLDDGFESSQMVITSEDGMHFDNFHDKKVIIPPIEDVEIGDKTQTRDPKVWRGKDAWYMVIGSKTPDNSGKLIFYKSDNLLDWEYVNSASGDRELGWMWECPDYFETEGGKVLVMSPMGIGREEGMEENHTICMPVEFEEATCNMTLSDGYQYLDYGMDLYAPQTTLDKEGRRVLVAWLRMPEPVDGKWRGMFCIPRVVEVSNGHIYFRVHPNIERVFTKQIASVEEADAAGFKVSLDIEDGETIDIGGYSISRRGNVICTDRSGVYPANTRFGTQFATTEVKDGFHLDVYVDSNMIEVFVNNGEYVISNAVYGLAKDIQAECMEKVRIYTLE